MTIWVRKMVIFYIGYSLWTTGWTGWPKKKTKRPNFLGRLDSAGRWVDSIDSRMIPVLWRNSRCEFQELPKQNKDIGPFCAFFHFFSFLASLSSGFLVLRTVLVRRPLRQEAEFCKIWLSEFEALADPMKFLGRSVVISVSDGIKKASTIWSFLKWGVPPNQKKNHRMFHQKKHLFWGFFGYPHWKPVF